jgi:pyruvate/2-oxoglutarate dehydrogenase complex dihydrolipoamide dehydrogenase (E3) component
VEVGGETLESEYIFLNVGTRSATPPLPGLDTVSALDNASLMELTEIPKHLLVLGGGYIGVEFGQMFRRFGSEVTVVHRGPDLLSREDPDVTTELRKALEAEGMQFLMDADAKDVEKTAAGIALTVEVGGETKTVHGTHLLVATGRTPNTDDLGLEQAGVETDARGYARVNSRLETNVPGIWALGDVTGGPAFTHISWNDYQIVYGNLVEKQNLSTEGRIVPYAVFTDPQLGCVGMTEREARASGRPLKIGKVPMSAVARALERDETAGVMKILVDGETDQILGASILGVEGAETVQLLGFMMRAGVPYTLLKGAVYIHPTLMEGFYGLMDSVQPAT